MKTLSEDERIAQLFMVAAYSNKGESHKREITDLVENYRIGGLMFLHAKTSNLQYDNFLLNL